MPNLDQDCRNKGDVKNVPTVEPLFPDYSMMLQILLPIMGTHPKPAGVGGAGVV